MGDGKVDGRGPGTETEGDWMCVTGVGTLSIKLG